MGVQSSHIFNIAGGDVMGVQATGIFNTADGDVSGIQASGIFNTSAGDVMGIQATGIFNDASGEVLGIQSAGIFNRAKTLKGLQAALVNINGGGQGAMFGLVNVSKSEDIAPFGLVNVMKNGILHPSVYFDDMLFTNIGFRSGSKHFYTSLSAGVGGNITFGGGGNLFIWRGGFGFEIPANKFFFDIDFSSGSIIDLKEDRYDAPEKRHWFSATQLSQFRLIGGYKLYQHLGIFAGLSYDYLYRHKETCPDPREFGGPMLGGVFNRHTHKFGFFGGIQF
jgi:hypothetical protein